jgi:hypothetical protein
MVSIKCNSSGFDFMFPVPADSTEFNENARRALTPEGIDACTDEANMNILYRSVYPQIREAASEKFEKLSTLIPGAADVPRKTTTKELKEKQADGSPVTKEVYDESDTVHINRVKAELVKQGLAPTLEAATVLLQPHWDAVVAGIKFDASQKERKPAEPKKPGKQALEFARVLIQRGQADVAAKQLSTQLGRPVATDEESLALAMQENLRRLAEIAQRDQMAALGITV